MFDWEQEKYLLIKRFTIPLLTIKLEMYLLFTHKKCKNKSKYNGHCDVLARQFSGVFPHIKYENYYMNFQTIFKRPENTKLAD